MSTRNRRNFAFARLAVIAILGLSSLSIAVAGSSAAGLSIFDSVGEFLGLQASSTVGQPSRPSKIPTDVPLHVYGTGWLRGFDAGGPSLASAEAGSQDKFKEELKVRFRIPNDFDCSTVSRDRINVQENHRAGAIMIYCGLARGGSVEFDGDADAEAPGGEGGPGPLAFGATDRNVITGTESSPRVVQSETFTTANPDNPMQVVVAYNDSRGGAVGNISGASVSTDGGGTFTRVTTAGGQSPFANTFGDPVVLYHKPTGNWVTVWLDGSCGSQGLGGYRSTTPDVATSWTHFCVHTNSQDDRNSGWADNNPASPFFGRMYISYNDFNIINGALAVARSTDGGLTWSSPVLVTTGTSFFRDVQITGDPATGRAAPRPARGRGGG